MLTSKSWSPYLAGALIGVLSWIAFLIADKPLGVSTTYVRLTHALARQLLPQRTAMSLYFGKYEVTVDWQMMLVLGIFLGAMLSAATSHDLKAEVVPDLWKRHFGRGIAIRWLWAFVGGVLLLFGARLAGGCTSGHGISGGLQLALSSWIVFISMMVGGIAAANLIFRKEVD